MHSGCGCKQYLSKYQFNYCIAMNFLVLPYLVNVCACLTKNFTNGSGDVNYTASNNSEHCAYCTI